MLIKNDKSTFLEQVSNTDKDVFCIGAGNTSHRFINEYFNYISSEIVLFDNSNEKIGKIFEEAGLHTVIHAVCDIKKFLKQDVLIVITVKNPNEIYSQLVRMSLMEFDIMVYPFIRDRLSILREQIRRCYSDYYYYNHFDLDKRDEFVRHEMSMSEADLNFTLPYLPIYLTAKCTLNCEKCNNLMPFFKGNAVDFSLEKTILSLSRILDSVRELIFCELVGGEPFLYEHLEEILDFVGTAKKIRQIVIVTNGTVMPSDCLVEKLRKYNVMVRISDYGMLEKVSRLVCMLEKEHVNTRVLSDMKWNDPGGIHARNRRKEELFYQYNKCVFSIRCKYLLEDKLFTCARIASLYLLGITDAEGDFMDIDDTLGLQEKLRRFYLQDCGVNCDYCDLCTIDGGNTIQAAIQKGGRYRKSDYTLIRTDELERLKRRSNG